MIIVIPLAIAIGAIAVSLWCLFSARTQQTVIDTTPMTVITPSPSLYRSSYGRMGPQFGWFHRRSCYSNPYYRQHHTPNVYTRPTSAPPPPYVAPTHGTQGAHHQRVVMS